MNNLIKLSKIMNQKNPLAAAIIVLVVILAGIFTYISYNEHLASSRIQDIDSQPSNTVSRQQASSIPEIANKAIIYADAKLDKTNDHEPLKDVDFYSIKLDGSTPAKLFSISADQINAIDLSNLNFKFCSANQKMYLFNSRKEIDLKGNIRSLDFMQMQDSKLESLKFIDAGTILSPDCSKVIWGNAYDASSPSSYETIYISDLSGNNKNLLLDIKKDENNKIKLPLKWSAKDPNLVYFTDYDWDGNGGGGGLYTLDISSGKINRIPQVPLDGIVNDISSDENKIVYGANPIINPNDNNITVLNLIDNTSVVFTNGSNGKKIFSSSGNKIANEVFNCNGAKDQASCTSNLYVFAGTQNTEVAPDIDLMDWLSENKILGSKSNTLIGMNSDGSEMKNITATDNNLVYIGMLN